jgi:exosortase A-associated hydrolase 2
LERPFFILNGKRHIFSVLHTPDRISNKKGIIFIHPYAEEKQRVDRIFVNLARRLCGMGHFVMRFDFSGCGDSEGDFEELSSDSQISDIRTVKSYFLEAAGIESILLFGARLGSNIAVQYAGTDREIDGLILWSPITNGAEYAETLLRNKIFSSFLDRRKKPTKERLLEELQENGRVDIDGFYLTKDYYEYLGNLNEIPKNDKLNCSGFIGITESEGKFPEKYSVLKSLFEGNGKRCSLVPTSDRLYWDQRAHYQIYSPDGLIEKTLGWIAGL